MTNLYSYLQKKGKKDVLMLGKAYAYKKLGFAKFVEKNWNVDNGDFVRAVVTSAILLIDRPVFSKEEELPEQIYNINKKFGADIYKNNKIIDSLVKYFNNGEKKLLHYKETPAIEVAYLNKIHAFQKILKLKEEEEKVHEDVKPILSQEIIAKLKSYNGKNVLLSLFKRKEITTPKIYKIHISGHKPNELKIRFAGNNIHLISALGGVASLSDIQTGEVIFDNKLKNRHFNNQIEKNTYLYGFKEAKRIAYDDIRSLSTEDDKAYRENEYKMQNRRKEEILRAKKILSKDDEIENQ